MKAFWSACLASAFIVAAAPAVQAQESTSAPLVKKLITALDAARTDLFAAKDPSSGDYVCVLYVAGSQMMVVSAKYPVPQLMDASIEKEQYNEVYMDLNTANVPGSRFYVEDMGADGLKSVRAANAAGDSVDSSSVKAVFDNDWKKQRMTQEAYDKAFKDADARYAHMLSVLIAGLDKTAKLASR